jgi:hypothetical protein
VLKNGWQPVGLNSPNRLLKAKPADNSEKPAELVELEEN